MVNQKRFISLTFLILGWISLLLLFPMLISGGPGQEQKGTFLLNQMAFGVGCLICGSVLSKEKRKWVWAPLAINSFMTIKLGFDLVKNSLSPDGALWLQRNSLLPLMVLFLVYSEFYIIRTIGRKPK